MLLYKSCFAPFQSQKTKLSLKGSCRLAILFNKPVLHPWIKMMHCKQQTRDFAHFMQVVLQQIKIVI